MRLPTRRLLCSAVVAAILLLSSAAPVGACDKCGPACQCGPSCRCGSSSASASAPASNNELQVRKNAMSLSDLEKQEFVDAILEMKRRGIYDTFVIQHAQSTFGGHAHGGPAFLPWHRQFLLEFERELQKINPKVTIPYWDFTVDNSPTSAIWAPNFMGGNGDPNNFQKVMDGPFRQGQWTAVFENDLRREFGLFAPTLPTPQDVQNAMRVMIYDVFSFDSGSPVDQSFRNFLEGFNHPSGEAEMHNRVHLWIGGTATLIDQSLDDPIFWLLHANFDRLWGEWEDEYGLLYNPVDPLMDGREGHSLHEPMTPFGNVTPADVLSQRALGYLYDTQLSAQVVPEPGALVLGILGAVGLVAYGWRRGRRKSGG